MYYAVLVSLYWWSHMLNKNKSHVPLDYYVFIELNLLTRTDTDHWLHSLI